MTGMVTTTEAVASWEYGGLNGSGPTKYESCAGTVRAAVVEVSEIASTNSFQAKKKVRIAAVNTPGAASGTIVEVYSQGYRYRDDVLRPAKVVVAA